MCLATFTSALVGVDQDVEGLCFSLADGRGIFPTSHLRSGLLCTLTRTHNHTRFLHTKAYGMVCDEWPFLWGHF